MDPTWTPISCWPPSSCSLVMLLGLRVRREHGIADGSESVKQNFIKSSVKLAFPAPLSVQTSFYPIFRLEVRHAFLFRRPECLGGN